ncbi:MAG: recombinase family protein, partial [Muribaculaceae bacterium]|nr:recombinase family protein [Muribaculaceae bacterium]
EARDYHLVHIYEEIVSGETIIHRPEMLKLLQDVEAQQYDAVLVMDIDRLGRGNMQDQGLILDTFKNSRTKIITPRKIYDLSDEFDEEYSEFEAFMARKELKHITRRMQRGRVASVKEGNYIGTRPPYGYSIRKDNTGRYLVENKEQAEIVRLIFSMYADSTANNGSRVIAQHLNNLGIRSYTGKDWSANMIVNIIKNPVYNGKVTWKKKSYQKSNEPNKRRDTKLNPKEEWIVADGKHKPIVDVEIYKAAVAKMEGRYHLPFKHTNGVANQFAGLLICGHCGKNMIRRPMAKGATRIICGNRPDLCNCKSARFDDLERKVVEGLEKQLVEYEHQIEQLKKKKPTKRNPSVTEKRLAAIEDELKEVAKQKNNLHDLLERGVYDIDTFLERSQIIADKIAALEKQKNDLKNEVDKENKKAHFIEIMYPRFKTMLELYKGSQSPEEQNNLLRSVVRKIVYYKYPHQKNDDFRLEIVMLDQLE